MTEQEEADRREGWSLAARCMMEHGIAALRDFADDLMIVPSSFFSLGVREFVATIEAIKA